jgi:hypothetical protein
MRTIGLLLLLFSALSNVAMAQASECQSISNASERKACLDKAPPAWVAEHSRQSGSRTPDQATSGSNTPSQRPLADVLAEESSKLNAKMKNVCRGC